MEINFVNLITSKFLRVHTSKFAYKIKELNTKEWHLPAVIIPPMSFSVEIWLIIAKKLIKSA